MKKITYRQAIKLIQRFPWCFICFPGTDTFKVRNRISLSFKISPFRADKKKKRSGFLGLIGFFWFF
jgi:hypothetical protein